MENGKDSNVSVQDVKNTDIREIIGANIRAIKERLHLTGKEFYELIYPGGKAKNPGNKISDLVHGRKITIDDLVAISKYTNTPFFELFTGIDEKNKDTAPTAYDVCRTFYNILASGMFNIEGTSKLQKQGKVWPFEKEKPELDKYYDFPCMGPDGPTKFDDYPQPIYIRIMPRYFLEGADVIEYKGTDDSFNFLKSALELYSCDLPEESKFHYIRSELSKVSREPIIGNDFYIRGEYGAYSGDPFDIPEFHEPW